MEPLVLHFLNVGKGNCTVIDFPSGRLSLVDIDDSRSLSAVEKAYMEVVEKKAALTNPVDYIVNGFRGKDLFRFILTHPDMDHMSGIKALFEKKIVTNFWDTANRKTIDPRSWSASAYDKADWDYYQKVRTSSNNPKVLNLYRDANADCCWPQDGIEVLSPTPELVREAEESEEYDHLSYVLGITHQGKKILLGGDATTEAWENIIACYGRAALKSDVLLAPNHGSKNHISKEILDAVQPRLTVVSVAEGVDYAYALYSQYGTVLSTKHFGNVMVGVVDGGQIYYRTQFGDYNANWHALQDRVYKPLAEMLGIS